MTVSGPALPTVSIAVVLVVAVTLGHSLWDPTLFGGPEEPEGRLGAWLPQ